jgi:hypothetical protein
LTLKQSLKSDKVETRFAAAYVVGEKKVPLPQELIALLSDRNQDVQQVARRSLILLAYQATAKKTPGQSPAKEAAAAKSQVTRLLKLGPSPTTNKSSVASATKRWKEWWEQNDPELEKLRASGQEEKHSTGG